MTLDEIKIRVEYIRDIRGDDEAAHGEEDRLRADFIEYVTKLPTTMSLQDVRFLQEKAQLVLSTNQIKFSRWCA